MKFIKKINVNYKFSKKNKKRLFKKKKSIIGCDSTSSSGYKGYYFDFFKFYFVFSFNEKNTIFFVVAIISCFSK